MQIVIDIHNAPIEDYQDLYYKIHGMAASEGVFDDKEKSQRALALKAVLDVLEGVVNGIPIPKGHGRIGDLDALREEVSSWGMNDYEPSDFIDEIDRTDTIIEADKEQKDDNT